MSAPALLVPTAVRDLDMSLSAAGLLAVAPTLGGAFTLVAWGALADRFSERWVFACGLLLSGIALLAGMRAHSGSALTWAFLTAGMAAASSNATSGRLITGWFPRHRRGLAMGIRQMAPPLGACIAALTVPEAVTLGGVSGALIIPVALCLAFAVGITAMLADPPESGAAPVRSPGARDRGPYRESLFLWRIHLASVFAVIPQLTLTTFSVAWLVLGLGWSERDAGLLLGVAQLAAGVGRILVGATSDRLGSRVGLMRVVLTANVLVLVLLAATSHLQAGWVGAGIFVATIATQTPNGLAFTAVAERAGPRWSGRALGLQNTGQFVVGALIGPVCGALITGIGYGGAMAVTAVFGAAAIVATPSADEHTSHGW